DGTHRPPCRTAAVTPFRAGPSSVPEPWGCPSVAKGEGDEMSGKPPAGCGGESAEPLIIHMPASPGGQEEAGGGGPVVALHGAVTRAPRDAQVRLLPRRAALEKIKVTAAGGEVAPEAAGAALGQVGAEDHVARPSVAHPVVR